MMRDHDGYTEELEVGGGLVGWLRLINFRRAALKKKSTDFELLCFAGKYLLYLELIMIGRPGWSH